MEYPIMHLTLNETVFSAGGNSCQGIGGQVTEDWSQSEMSIVEKLGGQS
jgi:hypothetical protein